MKRTIFLVALMVLSCVFFWKAHASEEKLVPYRYETNDKSVEEFRNRILGTPTPKTEEECCMEINGEKVCHPCEA